MNQTQKRILVGVMVILLAMLVYPPFQIAADNRPALNMGYGWIFDPPKRGYLVATVNIPMLLVQWLGIVVVGGLAFFLAKGAQQEPNDLVLTLGQALHDGSNRRDNGPTFVQSDLEPGSHPARRGPRESKQGPTGVGGWLLLLVAGMTVLGPLLGASRISVDIFEAESQYPELASLDRWATFKSATWLVFLSTSVLSFYGGWGLVSGKNWFVIKRAKAILWIVGPVASLVIGVLIPIVTFGGLNSIDPQFVGAFIASVIAAAIWTAYLSKSKRVRNTYGPSA